MRPYVDPSIASQYMTPQGGSSVSYFFTPRGKFLTEARKRVDLSINYNKRLAGRLQLFGQAQILNVFNQFALEYVGSINTTVLTNRNNSKLYARFDPFTASPQEGVNYAYGPQFGQAIAASAYTTPRTFRGSVGLRF